MTKHSSNRMMTEATNHEIRSSESTRSAEIQATFVEEDRRDNGPPETRADDSVSTGSAMESHPNGVQRPAIADAIPGSPADGHVIVGAEIRLRDGAAMQCESVDMADTEEVEAAFKLSRKAFEAAKGKIAARTQVSSAVLRVMAGIHGDCIKLSVVIDQRHLSNELIEEFEILSTEITTSLRRALTSAGATVANADSNCENHTPSAAPTIGSVEGVTDTKASPAVPLLTIVTSTSGTPSDGVDPNDMVAKRFREGVLAITRPGSLVVSLVANGKPDEAGPMSLANRGRSEAPVRRRDSTAQEMTGFVHGYNRSGKCEFKREGATARVDAEFPTDDAIAMLLRLACDNPAVTIKYHPYKDASDGVVCIQITKLIGLSAPWAGVTGAFANLALAVESLRKLVPKGRKRE